MPMHHPSHPGEVLREYMGDSLKVTELARHLGISRVSLSMILNGRAGISPEMSLKLDDAFCTSEGFWFRLQNNYDLALARRSRKKRIPSVAKLLQMRSRITSPEARAKKRSPAEPVRIKKVS